MIPEAFSYLTQEDRQQAIELARYIARRDWVLFAGSGVSGPSGLPLWRDLADMMAKRLGGKVESQDPLELASLFEANLGRNALIDFLRENLQTFGLGPNPLHDLLLDLRPPAIVTTNVDDLFEIALDQRRVSYALVVTDQDLALTMDYLQILKPHGDLRQPDSLVFTRRDYARYPQQETVNSTLCSLAAQRSFLFIGYSLNDPDLEHQLQKILDAQGALARHHYLVIDTISSLRRRAFLERQIHVIALGSYDRLQQFLADLYTEAERLRPSDTLTQSRNVTRSLELLELETADRSLLAFLEEDYAPVIEALEKLRLVDAENHLKRILKKIQQVGANFASTPVPGLWDFHQRVLLALATVATRRGNRQEADTFFHQAKELQSFQGKRRLQAAEVLINLGEFHQVETLLAGSAEADETRGREVLGLVALLCNDEARFHALYPEGDESNLEIAIAQARLAVESAEDATAKRVVDALERAWVLSQGFPLGLLMVAGLTHNLLRRIVFEEWEASGVDRQGLLRTTRIRYQQILSAFEGLADQYPEGLVTVLSQLLDFHRILGEKETQQALLARLQSLPGMTRERALVEHLAGGPSPALEVIEALFQKGYLSGEEKTLLIGATLTRDERISEAEQVYRQALSTSVDPGEQHALIGSLLNLLLKEERYEEALTFLEESTEPGELFRELMRAMIFSHRKDREGALTTLRAALNRHPRNIFLLENLIRLLSSQVEADGATSTITAEQQEQCVVLTEALHYAERLEALLPSFEYKLSRADLLERLGRYEEAFQVVEKVERDGYVTLQVLRLKSSLLHKLGRDREAAEFLATYRNRYPNTYSLRFNEAAAWAEAGEIERAVTIWEGLRHHPEANGDLYRNLFIAYIQRGALDPGAFSRAFDIAKEALEKFPDRREFAAGLIQAAMGSGRSREAWDIIGRRPDLQEGPYLRKIPVDEGLEFLVQGNKVLQTIEVYYRAGGVPFAAYAARSPRTPLFLWQVRVHLWRKGGRGAPLLCGFPHVIPESRRLQTSPEGIVLDMTALLTLGTLNITREILGALHRAGKPIFLFPGARNWLEEEAAKLSLSQIPAYRERHKCLQDQLLTAREQVEIITKVEEQKISLDEPLRQQLGIFAWDVEVAIGLEAPYVDDYLSPEDREGLPRSTTITSSDLLAALKKAGVLFSEEAERIRKEHPDPFANARTGVTVALDQPVMFSFPALLAWFEAGLLELWLKGGSGWPPRLVVGPIAWRQLGEEVTEDEIYREALQLASNLRASIVEALDSGTVEELPPVDPPDLGGHPTLRSLFAPTLTLFSQARSQKLALWTDDLCTHLLVDPRGPLLQEQPLMDMAMRTRQAFSAVPVIGTDNVLRWLESVDQLSRERRLTLIWQLHQAGYRFLDIGDVLLWLLRRFRYDWKAVPVDELLRDLEAASTLTLPSVNPKRFRLFVGLYVSGVLSRAIGGLWHLKDSTLTGELRKALSTKLVGLFERVTLQ